MLEWNLEITWIGACEDDEVMEAGDRIWWYVMAKDKALQHSAISQPFVEGMQQRLLLRLLRLPEVRFNNNTTTTLFHSCIWSHVNVITLMAVLCISSDWNISTTPEVISIKFCMFPWEWILMTLVIPFNSPPFFYSLLSSLDHRCPPTPSLFEPERCSLFLYRVFTNSNQQITLIRPLLQL